MYFSILIKVRYWTIYNRSRGWLHSWEVHRACQQVTGNEVSTSTLHVILIRWIFGTTCLYHNSQESSTFPRCHSLFHIVCFFLPANNLVVWCFLLWNYLYFVFNTHMYMYNYSRYFPWFFSPLWEMAQEGIDIKTIQWSQHWATGPPPNSTWTPSLGFLPRPCCCVLFNSHWYYQDIKLHLSLLLCEIGWMWCGYLATVNKLCTFYLWPHHYRVFVLP